MVKLPLNNSCKDKSFNCNKVINNNSKLCNSSSVNFKIWYERPNNKKSSNSTRNDKLSINSINNINNSKKDINLLLSNTLQVEGNKNKLLKILSSKNKIYLPKIKFFKKKSIKKWKSMKSKIKLNKSSSSKRVKIFKRITELKWEQSRETFKLLNKIMKKCNIFVLKKLLNYKTLLIRLKAN